MRKIFAKYPELSTYLFFLLVSILAYWQISFLQYSLQWDMLDAYLPWRYFAGDCLENGQLPLWNPYQHLGYPIHADLRSSWFPEVFIVGLTTGYSNIILHFLSIFYISIAGFGMFKLSQSLKTEKFIAIITGVAYMLSGFFICHGQDLGFIISASFIPWLLYYYMQFVKYPDGRSMLKTALLFLLMIFGAYPAFTITMVYFMALIFIVSGFSKGIFSNKIRILKSIKYHILLAFIILAGSSVLIITFLQVGPWVERLGGLTYEKASLNPFSPQCLLSWVLPFGMVKNNSLFQTDISMNNAYWGLIMMVFFVIRLTKRLSSIEWLFLLFGVFTLIASFGTYTPIHKFLFNFIPGMNVFRMPSFFSLFTILTFLIISGKGIQLIVDKPGLCKKRVIIISLIGLVLLITTLIISFVKADLSNIHFDLLYSNTRDFIRSLEFYQTIFIQSIIQILIIVAFVIALRKMTSKKTLSRLVLLLVLIEMTISVQLNMHFTGVNEHGPIEVCKYLETSPSGFPIPSSNSINQNTDLASKASPLWRNVNIFTKKPGFEGFNSFVLDNYDLLFDSLPELKNSVLMNELVYFSDKIYSLSDLENKKKTGFHKQDIFIEDKMFEDLKSYHFETDNNNEIEIEEFSPNRVKIDYTSKHSQILTILQSDYIGWEAYIDGKPINHFTSNLLFKSIVAPAGQHEVIYKYKNKAVRIGFYISYSVIIFLIFSLLFLYYKSLKMENKKRNGFYNILIAIVLIILFFVLKYLSPSQQDKELSKIKTELENLQEEYLSENSIILLNSQNKKLFDELKALTLGKIQQINISNRFDLQSIESTGNENNIILISNNKKTIPELEEYIRSKFIHIKYSKYWNNSDLTVYSNLGNETTPYLFYKADNFDKTGNDSVSYLPSSNWTSPSGSCFTFDTLIIWGPGINIDTNKDIIDKDIQINISCDILADKNIDAKFVIEIHRNFLRESWFGGDIQELGNNTWNKAILCQPLDYHLQEGDQIKAYIWSMKKKVFSVDNLIVNIIEKK